MASEIYLKTPTGQYCLVKCKMHRLSLGRDPSNDLVLDDGQVAPRHLVIIFAYDRLVQVRNNGEAKTLMGGKLISGNELEPWNPKEILQVGEYKLVWHDVRLSTTARHGLLTEDEIAALFALGVSHPIRIRPSLNRITLYTLFSLLVIAGAIFGLVSLNRINAAALNNTPTTAAQKTPILMTLTPTRTPTTMPLPIATRAPDLAAPELAAPILVATATAVATLPLPPAFTLPPVITGTQPITPALSILPTMVTTDGLTSDVLASDAIWAALGVEVEPAQRITGQPYWRLVAAQWQDEVTAQGRHNIYVEVVDENNHRLLGQTVMVQWPSGSTSGVTEAKPLPEYAFNFPMGAAGAVYSVRVEGFPSDIVHGVGMGTPAQRDFAILTSFQFKFQRTVAP
ncbi:MAG: FHA domain-containing protein [Chloroflexi bacterium]|nr:FHA domain-containing protein [Chloroflexota bacterium]